MRTMIAAAVCASFVTGCFWITRVEPKVTEPDRLTAFEPVRGASAVFRNLTHPDISPYWARAKSDGERHNRKNALMAAFGINWVPVAELPHRALGVKSRLEKRTVCGDLRKADIFIGAKPTTELDWNLILKPVDRHFVDPYLLTANALRVREVRANLSVFFEKSGKYLNTEFWHSDGQGGYLLEVEVSAPRELLESNTNPLKCVIGACDLNKSGFQELVKPRLAKPDTFCAYGPWVQEAMHGFRPEIHPSEALYWQEVDGHWELLMLQDASSRFDASDPGKWFTVLGGPSEPQNEVDAEHWLQEAMVGEFVVPLGPGGGTPNVEVVGAKGLEAIGANEFPPPVEVYSGAAALSVDKNIQAVVVTAPGSEARYLVLRAQIRGASKDEPFSNHGAFLHLRISGAAVANYRG